LRLRLFLVDGGNDGLKFLDVALVLGADERGDYAVKYFSCVNEMFLPFPRELRWPLPVIQRRLAQTA